ncbi:MAG: DUF892 family protein [Armatimonadetes bacterium]|nr:DUF892 family protein [Armatimonadota bacterium]
MSTTFNTLEEKFLGQLPLVYFSEQQFAEALGKMSANATDPMLKSGLQKHLEETKQHATNLETVFFKLGRKPETEKCPICLGLVASGETAMKSAGTDALRDASIVGSSVLVEHYEMAAYKGLVAQAEALGMTEIAGILKGNLQQEEQTAQRLENAAPMMMQKAA